jgi:hypothetical protein
MPWGMNSLVQQEMPINGFMVLRILMQECVQKKNIPRRTALQDAQAVHPWCNGNSPQ